jgi:hypothetical protein
MIQAIKRWFHFNFDIVEDSYSREIRANYSRKRGKVPEMPTGTVKYLGR